MTGRFSPTVQALLGIPKEKYPDYGTDKLLGFAVTHKSCVDGLAIGEEFDPIPDPVDGAKKLLSQVDEETRRRLDVYWDGQASCYLVSTPKLSKDEYVAEFGDNAPHWIGPITLDAT